jgi:uncharacterized protein
MITVVNKFLGTVTLSLLPLLAIAQIDTPAIQEWQEAISDGYDINDAEADGTTLLMRAIHERNTPLAELLIESGADVTVVNRYGMTALMLAARRGSGVIARKLLDVGANPNTMNLEGESALMSAARAGSVEVINALLEGSPHFLGRSANPDMKDGWKGQTALMWAAGLGHTDAALALLAGGADINLKSTVINIAPVDPKYYQGGFVYTDIPKGRMTALLFATREGKMDTVNVLIDAGADINAVDNEGTNALILATLNGHLDIAGRLLDSGADPDIADRWGRTALFVATDLNTMDANPRPTPMPLDTLNPVDIVRLALNKGANPAPELQSSLPAWMVVGAAHNGILNKGATPFFRAAMSGDLEIMRMLVDAGADPMKGTEEREGMAMGGNMRPSNGGTTPFMVAAGVGWRQGLSRGREADALTALEWLINEYGMDINAINQSGETALHGASYRGSIEIARWLIDHGADFNLTNARDMTPLDIALGNPEFRLEPNPEFAEFLREYSEENSVAAN